MPEQRRTHRRHGVNQRDILVIHEDAPDWIDLAADDIESCPLARFEMAMQRQYIDWQQFIQWMEAKSG